MPLVNNRAIVFRGVVQILRGVGGGVGRHIVRGVGRHIMRGVTVPEI